MKIPRLVLAALLLAVAVPPGHAAQPGLIVAIVVDQLRYDYLDRFRDQFTGGGFRRLIDGGAFLTFAHYDYSPTVTGPGHASYLSGAPPAMHGIIGNDWLDKRTLKMTNCVSDPAVEGVGTNPGDGKRSPRNFIGGNFADELRLRFQSKVVGVSLKDRGAILPAGRKPAGAYWFDSETGHFVTSTYYMAELPAWVRAFNDRKRPAAFVGQTWKRLLDPKFYTWPDEAVGEGNMPGEKTPAFDHTILPSPTEGFETIVPTPFGNQLLAEFAIAALEGEQLGTGGKPDLLTISFSSIDAAGHRFGPYSQEIQDMMLRLDRELAALFTALDGKVGLANVMTVLTADHGVAPTPEFAASQGLDGRRGDLITLMGDLVSKLGERFGDGRLLLTPRLIDGNLYFNHDTLREKKLAAEEVATFIRDWALDSGNFQASYTRSQLLEGRAPGALGQRVLNGFHPERSGDVVLITKPFVLPFIGKTGTTHGSPYSYDTHVPVLFHGAAFKPGRYADAFNITDIAPTLCAALGMTEPPASIGKPLTRILAGDGPSAGAPPKPSTRSVPQKKR
jgi:Type I phosphodiesterase / nucleotide pyrophosphatase